MVKLKKSIRTLIISKIKDILFYFPEMIVGHDIVAELRDREKPISYINHLFFINSLHRHNYRVISDIDLIMLCGQFDREFPAGESFFTPDQTRAINAMNDAILKMRYSEVKKKK